MKRNRILKPAEHLGRWQKIIINLFTLCDGVNALTDRKFFRDRPYAYAPYIKRSGARTFREKMQVIWRAKEEKTAKLIRARRRYGTVPARYQNVCKKTPCGRLRLWAAYLN
jgi:hypothetical protein